jgi:hypothetical protein
MWEFLIFSPLNIILVSSIMVVMVGSWPVSKSLLELELNSQSLSSGLSPSVVVLEEHVIQMKWVGESWSNLVHVWWDIASLINNSRSNLSDVHIDQKTVISINFEQFIFSQFLGVHIMLDITVLVGKDHIWMSVLVSWSLKIVDLKVLALFGLINAKVEITFGSNLGICVLLESLHFFLRELILESHLSNFVVNQRCNL